MRFPPTFLDEIRARLPVSQVVSRKVALKKKGREFSGLSPFKVEKTPSFFVNDQKGFYHCFASGEHGDIFKFVMTTEGLTFPEAVERLAGEAGLPMPKVSEREVEAEDRRTRLMAVLEASAAFFEACLAGTLGSEARRYLERRGLRRETISAFRLGFAPASRSALKEHLAKAGFTPEEMTVSGMLIHGDDIPVSYDRFRNRVMFPIADPKGRPIAFGGRALDPDAPAKYLNSPETPLFHKGHVLFNAHRARPVAYEKGRIIAVEGYMDVVALHEAGFAEAVAPLGTALTEDQVKLLWRMSPEPILCFDGDSAGRKAAYRALDVVLPHLRPGTSVAIAFLPDGLDPDDLIRQEGATAMEAVLSRCRPLSTVLFEREWAAGDWSTPERRAALQQRLQALVHAIADPTVREHYSQDVRRRLAEAWGAPRGAGSGFERRPQRDRPPASPWQSQSHANRRTQRPSPGSPPPRAAPSPSLLKSALVSRPAAAVPRREALLLRTLVHHPWLLEDHAESVADLVLVSEPMRQLRNAILEAQANHNSLDRFALTSQLEKAGLERLLDLLDRVNTHKCDRFAEVDAPNAEVEAGWRHALALHERQLGLKRALDAAERSWHDNGSEEALTRIVDIQRQLQALETAERDGFGDGSEGR